MLKIFKNKNLKFYFKPASILQSQAMQSPESINITVDLSLMFEQICIIYEDKVLF